MTNPFSEEKQRREANRQLAAQGSVMADRLPSGGPFMDFAVGFGNEIARLVQRPDLQVSPPDTTAAKLGAIAPETQASFLLPGAGIAGVALQGILAAGFSLLRNPEDKLGAAFSGGLAATMTGTGDFLGRTVKGTGARMSPMVRRTLGMMDDNYRLIRTRSQALRTLSETLGGSGGFNRQQQLLVNRSWVRAIGETGDMVTPAARRSAARRIGQVMDAALPTGPVDISAARATLDAIPADKFPGKARLMTDLDLAAIDPQAYQAVSRQLRDAVSDMARSTDALAWAREASQGLDELFEAGTAAGAADTRVVREQYKNLMLLESIPTVRRTGNVPPISAEGRIYSKYSKAASRTGGQGTLPETQAAIQTTQDAAEELSQRFRSSGTAERTAQAEAAQDVMGVLTGQTSPSRVLRSLGSLALIGPMAGAAAVATPSPLAGRAGAFGAREIDRRLMGDDRDQ